MANVLFFFAEIANRRVIKSREVVDVFVGYNIIDMILKILAYILP